MERIDRAWNEQMWNETYAWPDAGEEWSAAWGGSHAQWFATILPRIRQFLPCSTICEIGPGFGRWTKFLLPSCTSYVGVDLSDRCVTHCRSVFGTAGTFVRNDGLRLDGVPDRSCDLVFSFDSLVHADASVMEAYVPQIVHKLRPLGVAFLHHSNLGMLAGRPHPEGGEPVHDRYRATDVSAERVRAWVGEHGGAIMRQEIVDWCGARFIDCFTLFSRAGDYTAPAAVVVNSDLEREARHAKEVLAPWVFAPAPPRGSGETLP